MKKETEKLVLFAGYDQLDKVQSFYAERGLTYEHPEYLMNVMFLLTNLLKSMQLTDFENSEFKEFTFFSDIMGDLTDLDLYFIKDNLNDIIFNFCRKANVEIPNDWKKEFTWELLEYPAGIENEDIKVKAKYRLRMYRQINGQSK